MNIDKLEQLSKDAQYDICSPTCYYYKRKKRGVLDKLIYQTSIPSGKTINLFKVLLSNNCINNCYYCGLRRDIKSNRVSFTSDELSKIFIEFYNKGKVDGLFLTSTVDKDADKTMENMIKVAEILRYKYNFKDYIHLKILPNCSYSYVEKAAELSNRISINLEAPTQKHLREIAPDKDLHKNLLIRLDWIRKLKKKYDNKLSITTQFIVGAADEVDLEIIKTVSSLYKNFNLNRCYFSAFYPIKDTPFEDKKPTPLIREHRLYQVDFLLRYYGFKLEDIVLDENNNLLYQIDPKLAFAIKNKEKYYPIEVNTADYKKLLLIPGIGPRVAKKIIEYRRKNRIKRFTELKHLGCILNRAKEFILVDGKKIVQYD